METNQQIVSSSSGDDDPHRDPLDSDSQSAADEVNFGFNHLQIDANEDLILKNLTPESAETDGEEQEEYDDDDNDFTFVSVGDNDSPTTEVFDNGQFRTVFPLFDQSLLLGGDSDDGKHRLPINVPVDNVFIESLHRYPTEYGETDGTIRYLPKDFDSGTPEIKMKSNSTGSSKLWRFRNEMNRSNSDGRDAFVFVEMPDSAATSEAKPIAADVARGGSTAGVNVVGRKGEDVKKRSNAKKSTQSPLEVYLKRKGQSEEPRWSYQPYRPLGRLKIFKGSKRDKKLGTFLITEKFIEM